MKRVNICPQCRYAVPQENSRLGLVDCPIKGYGNSYAAECEHFRENSRLRQLKLEAVVAIREFERLYAIPIGDDLTHAGEIGKAAARSRAMQEAYAVMLDISYDMAADILHEEAKQKGA